jgi:hypothetical protein
MVYALSRAVVCFLLSMLVSTIIIRRGIVRIRKHPPAEDEGRPPSAWGFWIGFFEAILIFVFVIEREYTALAVMLAAKLIIGKEKIAVDPRYYLAGTLTNYAVAALFAVLARIWMSQFLAILLV